MASTASAMVDAGLTCLIEGQRRAGGENGDLDANARRRLEVAITAAHTVVEPPSAPTDELRAMGLWFDDQDTFLDRMKRELAALEANIGKLLEFIETSGTFTKLPLPEQERLRDQLAHMQEYGSVLAIRIEANA